MADTVLDLEDLRAQLDAARARKSASALTDDETARAKLLADLAEATAEAQSSEKNKRAIEGAQREATARKAALGKYLVKFFDLGALLPDADMDSLPGKGILVIRSPPTTPTDALGNFYRELEAKARSWPEIYASLACESIVYPDPNGASGAQLSAFFDGAIGKGTAMDVGDACAALGGVRGKQTKRGRG